MNLEDTRYAFPAAWGSFESIIRTPVGMRCLWCDEPIAKGDWGCTLLSINAEMFAFTAAMHRECLIRQTSGSVGHQLRECSCYGGEHEDPPHMTKREAAQAACITALSRAGR